jgi:hypothetical protein
MDNFKHYHLEERVLDLIGLPVDAWLVPNIQGNAIVDKYDKVGYPFCPVCWLRCSQVSIFSTWSILITSTDAAFG